MAQKLTVGVVSDTHGLLRPEALAALAGSDVILHAGDIGAAEVLAGLGALAPVIAVRGNVDGGWARMLPERRLLDLGGASVLLLHDRALVGPQPFREAGRRGGERVIVFGHSHQPLAEREDEVLWFNPGSCGPRRFRLPVSLGRLVIEGGRVRRRLIRLAACALLLPALAAAAVAAPQRVRPGTLVRWPGAAIESCGLGASRFAPFDGACLYPLDLLQRPGPLKLLRRRAGREEERTVTVGRFDYPLQRLTLPPELVLLSPEDQARVDRENAAAARLWTREGPRLFALPLAPPLDRLPRGGRFGSRRVINGRTRSPHGGADYAAEEGAAVRSVADGVVALVADHLLPGRCVFVDHGDGLITMYFHLSRVDVAEGEVLKRGARLGAVGHSGRVTGPHLHFGVRWRGARVDPDLLLGPPQALPTLR